MHYINPIFPSRRKGLGSAEALIQTDFSRCWPPMLMASGLILCPSRVTVIITDPGGATKLVTDSSSASGNASEIKPNRCRMKLKSYKTVQFQSVRVFNWDFPFKRTFPLTHLTTPERNFRQFHKKKQQHVRGVEPGPGLHQDQNQNQDPD